MIIHSLVSLILQISFLSIAFSNINQQELNVLFDLYNSTNGVNWYWNHIQVGNPWNFSKIANPCEDNWQGVICSNLTNTNENNTYYNTIISLKLPGHGLHGTLPLSIGNLSNLIELNFAVNNLYGTIPSTIGNLTQLQRINISENHWSGTIPYSIGNLIQLESLDLSGLVMTEKVLKKLITIDPTHQSYGLNGTLPITLKNLIQLRYFSVGFNALTGSPSVLGHLLALEYMYLYLNMFTSTLPVTYYNLKNLKIFSIGNNMFTGSADSVLQVLYNNHNITQFIIGLNYFTGTIPYYIGQRTKLMYLDLSYNLIISTLPYSISNLTELILFNVGNNSISGTIPSYIHNMKKLLYFNLNNNVFTSTLPSNIGSLPYLQFFDVGSNQISGFIPESYGLLTSIQHFNVGLNYLTYTIPSSLGNLTNAYLFDMNSNYLTGTLPSSFGYLYSLQFLNISNNLLTNNIPYTFQHLKLLTTLDISMNQLNGLIFDNIGEISSLQFLYLQKNNFEKVLPSSIATLQYLNSLLIYDNQFTGTLNHVFNSTIQKNLSIIQISNNQFTGTLSNEIFNLKKLNTFVAVVNCFHGSLPTNICNAKELITLAMDGLQSAISCQNKILPEFSNAYTTKHKLHGGIPSCLFTLPAIQALHLSGNGLTGKLPNDIMISTTLKSLSLSNNILAGSIPFHFQTHEWSVFDLSFNHFSGTLTKQFEVIYSNSSISLQTNRLSGRIPSSISHANDVSVLRGNLFSCDLEKKELPSHDSDKDHYVCGSTAFDAPYYMWLATLTIALLVILLLYRQQRYVTVIDLKALVVRLRCYYEFPISPTRCYQTYLQNNSNNISSGSDRSSTGNRDCTNDQDNNTSSNTRNTTTITSTNIENISTTALMDVTQNSHLSLEDRLQQCKYICEVMVLVCQNTIYCSIFICIVLLLYYPIGSHYYSTHEDVYAYILSAAFVAGTVPFILEFCLFTLFMGVVLVVFQLSLCIYEKQHRNNQSSIEVLRPKIMHLRHLTSRKVMIYGTYFLINIIIVFSVNIGFIYISLYGTNTALIAAQIFLSLFKLAWNNILTFYASMFFKHTSNKNNTDQNTNTTANSSDSSNSIDHSTTVSRVFHMQLFVMLLNNIAIPCCVVAAISPGCFYNLFIPAPPVQSYYNIQQCIGIVLASGCNVYTTSTNTVSYNPPYSYSYQCSSSFVKNYAPAFIYMCFAATFIVPLGQELLAHYHRRLAPDSKYCNLLNRILKYPVLRDNNIINNTTTNCSSTTTTGTTATATNTTTIEVFRKRMYFNANQLLLNQLTFFGILATFGVVFPPLAVALAFTICFVAVYSRLKLGYFLITCVRLNQYRFIDKINSECTSVVSLQMMKDSVWMLLSFAAGFYTLFLFDTLGDSVGAKDAYWVLIVMPLMPLNIYAIYTVYNIIKSHKGGQGAGLEQQSVGEGVVLSPLSVDGRYASDSGDQTREEEGEAGP